MPSGLQPDGQHYCKPCKRGFAEWDSYFEHLKAMRAKKDPKHICCIHCGQRFKTEKAQSQHVFQASFFPGFCSPLPERFLVTNPTVPVPSSAAEAMVPRLQRRPVCAAFGCNSPHRERKMPSHRL